MGYINLINKNLPFCIGVYIASSKSLKVVAMSPRQIKRVEGYLNFIKSSFAVFYGYWFSDLR